MDAGIIKELEVASCIFGRIREARGAEEGEGGVIDFGGAEFAIFKEEASLGFIAGRDPGIEGVSFKDMGLDEGVGSGERDTDLARFFNNFDTGGVLNPFALIGEKIIHNF